MPDNFSGGTGKPEKLQLALTTMLSCCSVLVWFSFFLLCLPVFLFTLEHFLLHAMKAFG